MNKIALSIVTFGLIIGISLIFIDIPIKNSVKITTTQSGQNIEIKDGIQYVNIDAKGGYFPRVSSAQAGIPTKLVVKTNGTYDCSAALVIRSIGYQKILTQIGEEIIDLGTPQPSIVQGICAMGMYSFSINFN